MNLFKSVLAGITLFSTAAAFAAPSNESIIIRITGSTAFRSQAHSAIAASFSSPPVAAYNGSSLSGAGQSLFYGLIGGEQYIITCSWAGSVGGIQTVTGALNVKFLPDTTADGTLALANAGGTSVAKGDEAHAPDVAMSDTYQSATPFKTPALNDKLVGVVGFKWVTNRGANVVTREVTTTGGSTSTFTVSDATGLAVGMTVKSASIPQTLRISGINGTTLTMAGTTAAMADVKPGTNVSTTFVTPSPITNINTQQAQALYNNGTASLAQFTGNSADAAVKVYATGRDPDSGTRLSAFAETRVGVNATVTQYKVAAGSNGSVLTGTTGDLRGIFPFPGATLNGIDYATGNMGENSGGTLASYFGFTSENGNSGGPAYLVGYVGASDATNAVNLGGKELTYNGVTYSEAAIKEGLYTFWCYEHVMYPTTWNTAAAGSAEAKKKVVIDNYANLIELQFSPIKLADMQCSRTADGGVVYHK